MNDWRFEISTYYLEKTRKILNLVEFYLKFNKIEHEF